MRPKIAPSEAGYVAPQAAPKAATRAILSLAAIGAWFVTQSLIASRGFPSGIRDEVHLFLAPVTVWLGHHSQAANLLIIATSGMIDLLGLFLFFSGILGASVRPLLGLFILFVLRQICQGLTALPPPEEMIWRYPGFPSLFVTYKTANDFFFSGHTAIAVYGAIELARLRRRWLAAAGAAVAVVEALTVLALRAHYTMDVFAAVIVAAWAAQVATKMAPACDAVLAGSQNPKLQG